MTQEGKLELLEEVLDMDKEDIDVRGNGRMGFFK